MQYNTVSVASTATAILTGNAARAGYILHNAGEVNIYLGGNNSVTTSNGTILSPGEKILADGGSAYNGAIWGIVSGGTCDLRFFEWGENDVT